jgi:hypothetical protein
MLSLIFRLYVRVWNRYSYLVLSYITVDKLFNFALFGLVFKVGAVVVVIVW